MYGAGVTWVAYLDESMRQRRDGLYVFAAAVFDQVDADKVREAVSELAHGKQPFTGTTSRPSDDARRSRPCRCSMRYMSS